MEITTQMIATRRDRPSSCSERMPMNRSSTCGMPKYPRPHARQEAIDKNPYGLLAPKTFTSVVDGVAVRTMEKKPSYCFTLAMTVLMPPADATESTRIRTRTVTITTPCIKSDALSAR